MILVTDSDGGHHELDAARFFTDEHNNLCIEDVQERLVHVFAAGKWFDVEGDHGAD